MRHDNAHRAFKDRLYGQFARIGKALASPHRLEILELLAQGERTVESLAGEIGLSVANTSQHLQGLREAGLVESRKQGLYVHYRLAELDRLVRDHFTSRADAEAVAMGDLLKRARSGSVVILDTRPASEYVAGHIAGAISVPVDELQARLGKLPKSKEYVAYCRGPYCVYADRAVELLRKSGRKAKRMLDGYPEWKVAGHPIETHAGEGVER